VKDQAELLRRLMAPPDPAPVASGAGVPVLVVGGGKGGVGKSLVAIHLARAYAERCQVLLVDGDQNLGTLHIMLGVQPAGRLEDVLAGGDPGALLTPVDGRLWLLPADSGAEALYALGPTDGARLHRRLCTLYSRFDCVVADGGSGLDSVVRVAGMGATSLVVVTVPEPAALADAYALIKIARIQVPHLAVHVLVNHVAGAVEARAAYDRLASACQRFLGRPAAYLGWVPEDDTLRRVTRASAGPDAHSDDGPAARALHQAALRLMPDLPAAPRRVPVAAVD
jgi:flagellar biosynthesis protein FlhG